MVVYTGTISLVGRILREVSCHCKNSLKKGVLTSKLSLDELETVLIEIENVINSRPLTYLEDEPYENLTPYHLIYGPNLASKRTDKEIKEFSSDEYIKSCKKLRANISYFGNKFKNEYLTALQERHTYLNKCKIMQLKKYCE